MQPLYFLPGCKRASVEEGGVNRQLLAVRGLARQFSDVNAGELVLADPPGEGPGGKAGCVIAYQTPAGAIPTRHGYYPDEIEWSPIGDGSLAWIGIFKASPPTEEDLRRKKQFTGYYATLADGNKWIVPTIRRPDDSTELPRAVRINAAGQYQESIKGAYRSYWEASKEIADFFFGAEQPAIDRTRFLQLAVEALSLNYRFTMAEQNAESSAEAWPLIDTESLMTILALSVDVPGATELNVKKN